jgi:hypothetical protein
MHFVSLCKGRSTRLGSPFSSAFFFFSTSAASTRLISACKAFFSHARTAGLNTNAVAPASRNCCSLVVYRSQRTTHVHPLHGLPVLFPFPEVAYLCHHSSLPCLVSSALIESKPTLSNRFLFLEIRLNRSVCLAFVTLDRPQVFQTVCTGNNIAFLDNLLS